MTGKDKGYVLITDALIALLFGIIMFTALLSLDFSNIKTEFTEFLELHYVSEDTFDVMNKKGTLDQVGYFWSISRGNRSSSAWGNMTNITKYHLERLVPPRMGYKMLVDDTEIYNSSWNPNRTKEADGTVETHASRFLVGYGENATVRGNVATARITAIRSRVTSAFAYFGGFVGNGNISRFIDLPADATYMDASMEMNAGDVFDLFVNGVNCGTFTPTGGHMEANIQGDISGCPFGPDRNSIYIQFTGDNLTKQYIGGGFIQVRYQTIDPMDPFMEKFYFPGIEGYINLYSSFYVPSTGRPTISGYLHYTRPPGEGRAIIFKVGNTRIYNSSASGEVSVVLNNSDFIGVPSSHLVRKTVPIRMFIIGGNTTADVVLTTDLSNSMSVCMGGTGCMDGFTTESSWDTGECGGFWADFDYCEDDRWLVNSGTWYIDDERAYFQRDTGTRMSTIDVASLSAPAAGDFTARFRMKINYSSGNNNWAGMIIRKQEEGDGYSDSGYLILYEWDGTLRLWRNGPGTLQSVNLPITPQQWRDIQITASGGNIRVSVDGTEYINVNDATYSYGHFSLVTAGTRTQFDDLYILPVVASPSNCPPEGVCYYFDSTKPGFLYEDINLHNITSSTCAQWAVVPNCAGGTPFCYCNPCDSSTRYQVAECGGQLVGGSYDACCDPATCCVGVGPCCGRDSWWGYNGSISDCEPPTWAANNLTHCRAYCHSGQWTPWQLGYCSANAFTNTTCVYDHGGGWRTCDEGSDPPGSPGTWASFCEESNRAEGSDSDMTVASFTANCNAVPEPLPDSMFYETAVRTCDGSCNNAQYLYCTAQYTKVQVVGGCPSGEHCQCFTEGTEEVCYEFNRILRGYRRYWTDCQSYYGRGWWPAYTNASQVCYDCVAIDQFYSCRNDYSTAAMDDSAWGTESTVDASWGCDRCSRFYRRTFDIPDASAISSLTLRVGSDDGAICYINDNVVHYDPLGHGWWRWNFVLTLNPSILVDGQNIIACQVKENTGGDAFNLQLEADTGMLIDEGDSWLYHHQEKFCGATNYHYGGASDYRHDPDSSTCEYGVWVSDCGNTYPADQPPLNVSAWARWCDDDYYNDGLMFVGEYLSRFLQGKYIENESGYSNPIPASFWNSADVLIVDGWGWSNYYKAEIKNALSNGKIVITNYDNFWDIHNDADVGSPAYSISDSYDHRCYYFNHGPGILIGDQYDYLAHRWRWSYVPDEIDKAANLLNAIYPVWYRGNDSNHICPSEYCLPGGGEKGCMVCNVTRLRLAKTLDKLFASEIVANTEDVRVGLAGYGSTICDNTSLTRDAVLLNNTINDYRAECGFTCISCAIEEGIRLLNESNAKKKYLIIMSDGEANTCTNDSTKGEGYSSCSDPSPYGATNASNETITLAHIACDVYNITVYTIGFGSEAGVDTLNKSATCGGSFYQSDDPDELRKIYEDIAKEVIQSSQTVETEITNTTLYNDSYLEFDYTPYVPQGYGEIGITYISPRFNNTDGCNGTIYIPADINNVSDFKIISYSAEHWTDYVKLIDPASPTASFDLLNDYSDIYFNLGDPYTVYMDPRLFTLGADNTVQILTGDSPPHNVTSCSPDNRAIYTFRVPSLVGYGDVFPYSSGCIWNMEFYDGTFINDTRIPPEYMGSTMCNYTNSSRYYDEDDALSDAVFRLLSELDRNGDGRMDIAFDPDSLKFDSSAVGGVRSLWGPIKITLIVWL